MSAPLASACGHSVCSQCFVDTGDPRCVDGRAPFALDSAIVGIALAIRAALPHVTLSEALTYADASTVQGRAFRGGRTGTFFGLGYSKIDLAFALAWYFTLWASETRNHVRGVRLGMGARLASETSEVRECYGAIVRKRHALLTGFERYARRAKHAGRACPAWPGTRNMRPRGSEQATIRAWLESEGIADACEALAPPDRGAAYSHMKAMLDAPEVHS